VFFLLSVNIIGGFMRSHVGVILLSLSGSFALFAADETKEQKSLPTFSEFLQGENVSYITQDASLRADVDYDLSIDSNANVVQGRAFFNDGNDSIVITFKSSSLDASFKEDPKFKKMLGAAARTVAYLAKVFELDINKENFVSRFEISEEVEAGIWDEVLEQAKSIQEQDLSELCFVGVKNDEETLANLFSEKKEEGEKWKILLREKAESLKELIGKNREVAAGAIVLAMLCSYVW
jgi:hypothetical protein